jgi:hypothetical protein
MSSSEANLAGGRQMTEQQMTNGKAVKFLSFAEKRVSKVLTNIRQVGKLSRRGTYDYSPEQVEKMFKAMRDELDAAERAFTPQEQSRLFQWNE